MSTTPVPSDKVEPEGQSMQEVNRSDGGTQSENQSSMKRGDKSSELLHSPSAFNKYMMFCCLTVGFGGLNWGYENALVGPISAMPTFVRDMQGLNTKTGSFVLTARNQSIVFSVPLTGTVVRKIISSPIKFF